MASKLLFLHAALLGVATAIQNPSAGIKNNFSSERRHLTTIQIIDGLGNRTVAYKRVGNGMVVIDSDIAYAEEYLLSKAVGQYQKRAHSVHETNDSVGTVWPNSEVFYKYDSEEVKSKLKSTVEEAIQRWQAAVPCLKFTEKSIDASWKGVVTISQSKDSGEHGSLGYQPNYLMIMALSPGSGPNETTHELGHILGLRHEHQRWDRENYTHFNCEALPVTSDCNPCLKEPTDCCGPSCDFNIIPFDQSYSTQDGDACGGAYDLNSLMHYPRFAGAVKGKLTFTKGPDFFPPTPSEGDICRIKKLYNCHPPPPSSLSSRSLSNLPSSSSTLRTASLPHPQSTSKPRSNSDSASTSSFPSTASLPTPLSLPSPSSTSSPPSIANPPNPPNPPNSTCPGYCQPYPKTNDCHLPCIPILGEIKWCVCTSGYKSCFPDNDTKHQWRVRYPELQDRVWLAEGVQCDTRSTEYEERRCH
ncbi:zincin [Lindgomyces ingoldianus]|uniref:Zincin n=1 Tax=Lindgomyces ingoldianus TaxID=673940 RepID=A0ACB6QZF1_9PLEO|nr:zincin [Lindgomyces ingoldianus]KAF2472419.1 zincin [Lindgomyces ingoldianus]